MNIQIFMNNLIDEYIENHDLIDNKPTKAMLFAELSILNKPAVYENYQRILNSPYIDSTTFNKMLIRNKANQDLNHVVETQIDRITKNLDYVERVLKDYEVSKEEYRRQVQRQKNQSVASRRKVIEDVLHAKDEIQRSTGINIPDIYSYRDLDFTAESLHRQSQMTGDYELAKMANEQAEEKGEPLPYPKKRWIWTGAGKTTRHIGMNGQTRDFDDTFMCVNEVNGDIDEIMYPMDPSGKPSNVIFCYCHAEYYSD